MIRNFGQRTLALALVLFCGIGGCARFSDAEQDVLCRRLIPALVDTARGVFVVGNETVGPGEIFIRFRLGDGVREHFIYCRFAGSGLSLAKRQIIRIGLDGATLGPSATHYLVDRWLESQDSVIETPPGARPKAAIGPLGAQPAHLVQQAVSALPRIGISALLSAAYALIYGLTGRINLAFGAFAALGGMAAVIGVLLFERTGLANLSGGVAIAILAATGLSALTGAVTARLVIAPLTRQPGQHMLIASIGLAIVIEEFLRLSQGARGLWLAPVLNNALPLAEAPGYIVTTTPMALLATAIALWAAAAVTHLVRGTRHGRAWRASSEEPVAAELLGIGQRALLIRTFTLASALAGLAGFLVVLLYGGMGYAGGGMLGMTALVAAIIGGIGSVPGAMLGGVLIGVFEVLWGLVFPSEWREVALFALLVLFLVLKPDGLMGGRQPGPLRV